MKNKCKCGHGEETHAPKNLGGCAVIYRKDGKLKSCECLEFAKLGDDKR